VILRDFPGPGILMKKFQDFPGGMGTLFRAYNVWNTRRHHQTENGIANRDLAHTPWSGLVKILDPVLILVRSTVNVFMLYPHNRVLPSCELLCKIAAAFRVLKIKY